MKTQKSQKGPWFLRKIEWDRCLHQWAVEYTICHHISANRLRVNQDVSHLEYLWWVCQCRLNVAAKLTIHVQVLAAFGTIGGMLFGFDISSMSAWIGSDQYLDYFHHPDSTLQGGITASMSAGSLVGALVAGFLADKLGRRGALQAASVVFVVGAALQASAQNVAHLIVGRVISGLSIGVTSSQSCVYLAELAPSQIRGRIVGIQQWSIEWGLSP